MRLDKFLKVSRLIKRRTVANEACDNARVTVNGRPAKASCDVKPGDVLRIAFGQRTLAVEVLAVADAVRKDDAAAMYDKASSVAPAFGMVGTLVGLINMLKGMNLEEGSTNIGSDMGTALITTLYGCH